MEPLHASVSQPQHPPQDAAKRILLLDCDKRRREVRAEALINRGVLVDRAGETGVARTLWKPGTYDLVLIDLRGADTDCAAFISFVHGECARQHFGFYVTQPPYVTASAAECRRSMHQQTPCDVVAVQHRPGVPARSPDGTGLTVAARRIAAVRDSARIREQEREEPQSPVVREEHSRAGTASEAVRLAERVLGGS